MKSIFRDLYMGDISPTEVRLLTSETYRKAQKDFKNKYEYFTKVLEQVRPDLNRVYDELCDMEVTMDLENSETLFFQGLSMGIMLVVEAMIIEQGVKP